VNKVRDWRKGTTEAVNGGGETGVLNGEQRNFQGANGRRADGKRGGRGEGGGEESPRGKRNWISGLYYKAGENRLRSPLRDDKAKLGTSLVSSTPEAGAI